MSRRGQTRGEAEAAGQPAPSRPRSGPIATLRRLLLGHYDRSRRALPWRRDADPYRVWVSEVMLQQTRVETVIPYYRRWMDALPDLGALADAPEDEVLRLWEGLGYYARARRLHEAARVVRDRHGGRLPGSVEALGALPGVGAYTAGAVASIAFGVAVPAVDGNARRVLCRLFDLPSPGASRLEALAASLVDPGRPGDFNQALMELGATVCSPRSPACGGCPLAGLCRARARGTVARRPRPRPRRTPPRVDFALAVLSRPDGRVLLLRRPAEGLLGGLWAFPEAELAPGEAAEARAREIAAGLGAVPEEGVPLAAVEHAFTHLRARYLPVLFRVGGGDLAVAAPGARWVEPATPEGVALPVAQRKVARAAAAAAGGDARPDGRGGPEWRAADPPGAAGTTTRRRAAGGGGEREGGGAHDHTGDRAGGA